MHTFLQIKQNDSVIHRRVYISSCMLHLFMIYQLVHFRIISELFWCVKNPTRSYSHDPIDGWASASLSSLRYQSGFGILLMGRNYIVGLVWLMMSNSLKGRLLGRMFIFLSLPFIFYLCIYLFLILPFISQHIYF